MTSDDQSSQASRFRMISQTARRIRRFNICENGIRFHNPFDDAKLRILGQALRLRPGARLLDLACGSGEMLCTWARDHQVTGTGVDIDTVVLAKARARAVELGASSQVRFVHADAREYRPDQPVDLAACMGATWMADGIDGTVAMLRRHLTPGGMLLIGELYWRKAPPDQATVAGCGAAREDEFRSLPGLIEHFTELGCDVVGMVLADHDSWDRYVATQWLNMRLWLDANPNDSLADEIRADLTVAPARYARYERDYLGWGAFALMNR